MHGLKLSKLRKLSRLVDWFKILINKKTLKTVLSICLNEKLTINGFKKIEKQFERLIFQNFLCIFFSINDSTCEAFSCS